MMTLPDIMGIEKIKGFKEIFDEEDSILENWIRISSCTMNY
ncbi:MAG TPA: hypothetical protein VGC02_02210 [Methanobacterium sp.]